MPICSIASARSATGCGCLEHVITVGGKPAWRAGLRRPDGTCFARSWSRPTRSTTTRPFGSIARGPRAQPKGAIHLQHDMLVAADTYARDTIGLRESDVSFSVAKLFFAYGLGNGLYFPLRTGGTTVLLPDRPTPDKVFATIDRYQPTVFYGVPTSYAALLHAAEKAGPNQPGPRADVRFGRRNLAAAHLSASGAIASAWKSSTASARPKSCTSSFPIFPAERSRAAPGQIVPGFEARDRRRRRRRIALRPRRHAADQGRQHRLGLLEPARSHQAARSAASGSTRTTSSWSTRTAISGTPAAPTT